MDRDQMDELLAPIGQLGAAMAALEVTDAAAEKALQEVLAGTDATDDEAAQRRGGAAHEGQGTPSLSPRRARQGGGGERMA